MCVILWESFDFIRILYFDRWKWKKNFVWLNIFVCGIVSLAYFTSKDIFTPFFIARWASKTQNDDHAKCAERDKVHLGNGVDKTENKATQD